MDLPVLGVNTKVVDIDLIYQNMQSEQIRLSHFFAKCKKQKK